MSVTNVSTSSPPSTSAVAATSTRAGAGFGTWLRVALVCGILVGSAYVRQWQAARIEQGLELGRRRQIDLEAVPLTIGQWEGEPTKIDEQIARVTGADQIVTRRYVNQQTGVSLELILLYGPAVEMYIHIPETCYPSAGYTLYAEGENQVIDAGVVKAPFRSLVYSKGEGAQADLQEVYYSWRYNGHWTPDIGTQKQFERIPSMYKVHVARRVTGQEQRHVGNPCEAFLRSLVAEVEGRIVASQSSPPENTGAPANERGK